MGKIVGIVMLLGGVIGFLYSWICGQKERQKRMEEFIIFLQKSIFAMESEKIKVIDYFSNYVSRKSQIIGDNDKVLENILHEIAKRLSMNTYPKGQDAWEEVLREEEANLDFDKETFGVILQVGNGFFGRSCEENICFLQKSLNELEKQQEKLKERDAKERKVWVPVGMLGGVMLMIMFV